MSIAVSATTLMIADLAIDRLISAAITIAESSGRTKEELIAKITAVDVKRDEEIQKIKDRLGSLPPDA
jgi:hypothetical protein